MIYISLDADDVGGKLEKLILENKEDPVAEFSKNIKQVISEVTRFLELKGFETIFSAGDNILSRGNSIDIDELKNYLKKFRNVCFFSVGSGKTLRNCYLSLKYAKSLGKDVLVNYDESNDFSIHHLIS